MERAVDALPKLLPRDNDERARTLRAVERLISAEGKLSEEGQRRQARIEKLFAVKAAPPAKENADVGA
jgi:hypothetical protein